MGDESGDDEPNLEFDPAFPGRVALLASPQGGDDDIFGGFRSFHGALPGGSNNPVLVDDCLKVHSSALNSLDAGFTNVETLIGFHGNLSWEIR